MDFDPHTIQTILQKIEQQMRCPQCGQKVPVDFGALKLVTGSTLVLQLCCDGCDTHIVLQASLQDQAGKAFARALSVNESLNASSALDIQPEELQTLRDAVAQAGGSFETLFKDTPANETEVEGDIEIV